MNAAEKFAQDAFIAQMAATLMAGEYAAGIDRYIPRLDVAGADAVRATQAAEAVAQARAIWDAATDARIKGGTQ